MYKINAVTLSLSLVFGLTLSLLAEEAEEWNGALEVGATLTDGNSNTEGVVLAFDYEYGWNTKNTLAVDASYKYGESDQTKNIDNSSVMLQYNRTVSEKVFTHIQSRYEMDDIADLDHRFLIGLGPGVGYYFVKSKPTKFSAETGLAWVDEDQGEVKDNWVVLRVAEHFEHKFNETARIFQKLEYLPKTEDFGSFLLSFEMGAESGFTRRTALRISLENKYNGEPEGDVENNDLTLKGGVVFKL